LIPDISSNLEQVPFRRTTTRGLVINGFQEGEEEEEEEEALLPLLPCQPRLQQLHQAERLQLPPCAPRSCLLSAIPGLLRFRRRQLRVRQDLSPRCDAPAPLPWGRRQLGWQPGRGPGLRGEPVQEDNQQRGHGEGVGGPVRGLQAVNAADGVREGDPLEARPPGAPQLLLAAQPAGPPRRHLPGLRRHLERRHLQEDEQGRASERHGELLYV
ncbi:Transcription repressor (Ovate family protein), partial [Psidium guajava]